MKSASLLKAQVRGGLALGARRDLVEGVSGDPASGTASFGYDAVGRLTSYTSPLGTGSNQACGWQKVLKP